MMFNEFDFNQSHRKLFDEEGAMDLFGGKNVDNFLTPNFYSHQFIDDPNYFQHNDFLNKDNGMPAAPFQQLMMNQSQAYEELGNEENPFDKYSSLKGNPPFRWLKSEWLLFFFI